LAATTWKRSLVRRVEIPRAGDSLNPHKEPEKDMEESIADKVLQETIRFRQALPELLKAHAGKWVVFRDGEVQSVHDSEEEAYRAGLEKFGREGGHVVAPVVEERPAPITAGVLFHVA
jgi:hypothetical protein